MDMASPIAILFVYGHGRIFCLCVQTKVRKENHNSRAKTCYHNISQRTPIATMLEHPAGRKVLPAREMVPPHIRHTRQCESSIKPNTLPVPSQPLPSTHAFTLSLSHGVLPLRPSRDRHRKLEMGAALRSCKKNCSPRLFLMR